MWARREWECSGGGGESVGEDGVGVDGEWEWMGAGSGSVAEEGVIV